MFVRIWKWKSQGMSSVVLEVEVEVHQWCGMVIDWNVIIEIERKLKWKLDMLWVSYCAPKQYSTINIPSTYSTVTQMNVDFDF